MSPSTNPPQDAYKRPKPGWWTCMICVPRVHERGGMADLEAHYNREHSREVKL